jgi:excisionase family DNA binding protein
MNKPSGRISYCTTREAANILGISLRTAQLWVDSGVLSAWRTEGGHRRIAIDSVDRLLQPKNQSRVPVPVANKSVAPLQNAALRILVVEADNSLLRTYKTRIESWHLPVILFTASNAYEALMLIGRESPDLMVADLQMTGLDPIKMLQTLSNSSLREGMEIAVVISLGEGGLAMSRGLPASVRQFPKPVSFAALRALVELLLSHRSNHALHRE